MVPSETVYVVDDDPAVCDALEGLLAEAGYVVKTFSSAPRFLSEYQRTSCECLIVDLRLPEMSGLDLHDQLDRRGARLPCIFLSGHGNIDVAVEVMKQGAVTFLEKPCRPERILAAVREGLVEARRRQLDQQSQEQRDRLLRNLDAAEHQVLSGILRGMSIAQIAEQLDLSRRTVQFRKSSLLKKLGVSSRAEVIELLGLPQPRLPDDALNRERRTS